jgi:molybdate-binding protein/DNA-binding transcriptional regulator YhcF (GntR family)
MDDQYLYQQIADAIRQDILTGKLKPGDRLAAIRDATTDWGCTNATIQRAYKELAKQGLVVSRIGQGTTVAAKELPQEQIPLRRAMLLNRIETNLFEIMAAGYSPGEVEQATRMALDRWRTFTEQTPETKSDFLRFVGSHDPAITLIAAQARDIHPGLVMKVLFTGSLGGLIALAENDADMAGCHLWDEQSDVYNDPFIHRLFPGKKMAALTLAHRRVGLIVPPGNPMGIDGITDLVRPSLRYVNRQTGSGTRVWMDVNLKRIGITPESILGYQDEKKTHFEVALAVATNLADTGLGVQTAAISFGLDFVFLTTERYDLVIPSEKWENPAFQSLSEWLNTTQAKTAIQELGGYDISETGSLRWVS